MNNQKRGSVQKICLWAGMGLLVLSTALLLFWQWGIHAAAKEMTALVDTLYDLMPARQNAVVEERRDNTMSVLSLDGTDYVGVLEMPRHDSVLPVCAEWGAVRKHPCCFAGSIYDGSMQIGATTQKGQYDFYREISVGDSVFFTDMEGNRYAFAVTDVRYEKHADQTALRRKEAALTLFIKNVYGFEYVVIFCDVPG